MDAPAARPALFRFERLASPAAEELRAAPPAGPALRRNPRAASAWRGPVLACGVTIAATAGLAYAVLAPEDGRRHKAAVPARTDAGVILISAEDAAAELSAAPDESASADVAAPPVVTALHLWDGRPIRAVPTDTLPEAFDAAGGRIPPDGVIRAGGAGGEAPSSHAGAVAPAVWLTGEIAE
ncbi:hypothetical protein [Alienimonas californiensis]|uniref:Uncharacterized protein n=1 Tax=Alienimonas californiensis TaxID=2527989 RepID=A0A517PEW6_9PLAN|nr:hypothetical protein [Alienimonas californiensis]QDT17917.1 hypothetical protein CA12_40550 [Alienimonas californiensis]